VPRRIAAATATAYVNFNFPVGSPQSNVQQANPYAQQPRFFVLDPSSKETILLFGRLAQEYYPDTPEQSGRQGEPYAYLVQGTGTSIASRLQPPPPTPKWERLFQNPTGGTDPKISRATFQVRMQELPFLWPLFKNETIVESTIYNVIVEQNLQAIEVAKADADELKAYIDNLAGGDPAVAQQIRGALAQFEMGGGNLPDLGIRKVRQRSRAQARKVVHEIFGNEELSSRVCRAFLDSLFGSEKKEFSRYEFARALGQMSREEFSSGNVDFETFAARLRESLADYPVPAVRPAMSPGLGQLFKLFGKAPGPS